MSEITLFLADDVFDLDFLPSGSISLEEYELKNTDEKLQLHHEALVKEIIEQLKSFQVEAAVTISTVKPTKGVQVVMRDFNISVFIADDITSVVEDAIYFHSGLMSNYEEIDITMHGALTR